MREDTEMMEPKALYGQGPRTTTSTNLITSNRLDNDYLEPLAIIGFSLKYPEDADTPNGFWRVLEERRDVMTVWPEDRLKLDAFLYNDRNPEDKVRYRCRNDTTSVVNVFSITHKDNNDFQTFIPGAHFLKEDLGAFDAPFFGISATEAIAMDVQQRKLLEITYHAFENAGIPMKDFYGSKTGVYSGSMSDDYQQILSRDIDELPKYAASGVARTMVANRLSWFYDFHGPSISMDSACSSSLMAFDFACQGLRNRDCNIAVVTGSSVVFAPDGTLSLINMNFLSPHGRCYSFDHRADGYARGEGFGVILLQLLGDAIRDNNIIRAVVRSSGSNQDGHTPGVTQPSREMQAALIRDTYEKAGLSFDETRFFEAHGTGTPLGDPIEAEAIGSVFRTSRSREDPLYIGALKANVGHLEGGSGVAGVIKTVMILEKGIIPPNANFEMLNPRIDSDFLNLKFPTKSTAWPSHGIRRASIASFGFGGSNSHAILDDAYNYMKSRGLSGIHCTNPHQNRSCTTKHPINRIIASQDNANCLESATVKTEVSPTNGIYGSDEIGRIITEIKTSATNIVSNETENERRSSTLLIFSASDEQGIKRLAEKYTRHFRDDEQIMNDERYLKDLAYTLSERRSDLSWRSFAVADSVESLKSLGDLLSKPMSIGHNTKTIFVFTGQGAQYSRMGGELLSHPPFKATIKLFDKKLGEFGCSWSVLELLSGRSSIDINDPQYSQAMTTAVQMALYDMLQGIGIQAMLVVGHSSGEIAAAYAAGALSFDSACKVSYFRGKCVSDLKLRIKRPGAMMSVNLPERKMQDIISHFNKGQTSDIRIACINSPCNVTISGYENSIDEIQIYLVSQNVYTHKLNTGVAYHSPHMNQVAMEYAASITGLTNRKNCDRRPTMISSVTGKYVKCLMDICMPEYWVGNLLSPVQFANAMSVVSLVLGKNYMRKLGTPKIEGQDIVEIGPHSTLRQPITDCLEQNGVPEANARYHSALRRGTSSIHTILKLVGELYARGYPVDVQKANGICEEHYASFRFLVDLPSYPFNHSRRYWYESTIGRHSRLRTAGLHELLGAPVPDWNPLEPRWRKIFNLAEMPWIEHHQVHGKIIYPAAGMVAMAIQGISQVAEPGQRISAYVIRDAVFVAPISIDKIEKSEVQLHMRLDRTHTEKNSTSLDFCIYSATGTGWVHNCRGQVQVVYNKSKIGANDEVYQRENMFYRKKYSDALQYCSRKVSSEQMYKQFMLNGLQYGPSFQPLENLAWDGECTVVGNIRCFGSNPEFILHDLQPHVIHPTVLDGVGQLPWVALTKGAEKVVVNGAVVTRIKYAWIAGSGLSYPDTPHLQAYCTTSIKGLRGTDSSIVAFDPAGNVVLRVSHVETTSVGGDDTALAMDEPRKICFEMKHKPDLALLNADQLLSLVNTNLRIGESPTQFYQDLELVLLYLGSQTLMAMGSPTCEQLDLEPYMKRYVAWLNRQIDKYHQSEHSNNRPGWKAHITDNKAMEHLISKVEGANAEGRFLVSVGRSLHSIIRGLTDPLEIMFQSGLVEKHYQAVCKQIVCCKQLINYLGTLVHKHPQLRVLEVGAGTGSITEPVLEGLGNQFGRYDYTDISAGFFEKAREKFAGWEPKIHYSVLDIEADPVRQGYDATVYDVVVAAWVLHATRDLASTIRNVRKLLKPGGKLILLEITQPDIMRNGFAFGTLPGWWLSSEPEREWSPCISELQWTKLLSGNGFRGVDVVLPDYESDICHENSILIATAREEPTPSQKTTQADISIIVTSKSSLQAIVAEKVRECVKKQGLRSCSIIPFADQLLHRLPHQSLIFLAELDHPHLTDLTESSFKLLQHLLSQARLVIWVTSSSVIANSFPDSQMNRGLARVLFTERPGLALTSLSFEGPNFDVDICAQYIFQVVTIAIDGPACDRELEYVERDGVLMINRVVASESMDQSVYSKTHTMIRYQPFKSSPPLALSIPNSGLLDSIRWEEDLKVSDSLGDTEIEIQVQAIGVNFRDLLVVLGKYNASTIGCECAGVVTRVGANCTTLKPGDRVCACLIGCTNTHARCHFQLAVKIPDCLSPPEAASLPTTGVTAYYSLITLAGLKRGESILIHSATGGTGQMALQIAQSIGAEVYVTVGSIEKRNLIKELYGISDDHIFNSRDTSFARDLYQATNGRGVDVVLNSLSNEALLASWECVAPFGRFIELGKMDIEANHRLPMSQFSKNVTFHAVAADHLASQRPSVVGKTLQCVLDLIRNGKMKVASPLHLYPVSELETAFRMMQSGKNTGKMVLTFSSQDIVPTWLKPKFCCLLDPNATYLIAGGFGGLGRSAARWMAQRGARNLILLSRSGPTTTQAQELLNELHENGVTTRSPKCDVSNTDSLSDTLNACSDMPAIKGCLQATMVLQDVLFETMSFEQWSTTIRSKVTSTWNLHTQLPENMSFFVMLSSVAGIAGSMGQSNYAAGNTFIDGLAAHRVALGQKAIALDLGWMSDIGAVAENAVLTRGKETAGDLAPIFENEFLALLDHYCNPDLQIQLPEKAQLIIGLVTPAQFYEKGLMPPDWLVDRPMFRGLTKEVTEVNHPTIDVADMSSNRDWVLEILRSSSTEDATNVMVEALIQRLSKATSTSVDEISRVRPLHVYGVDSLLAVELRNWFGKVFKADVTIFDITGQGSLEKVAEVAVASSELLKGRKGG